MLQLKRSTVRVGEVSDGDAEKLRHHLESVVDKANADTGATEEEAGSEQEDSEEPDQDDRDGQDTEMTERFRGFGQRDSDDSDESDDHD